MLKSVPVKDQGKTNYYIKNKKLTGVKKTGPKTSLYRTLALTCLKSKYLSTILPILKLSFCVLDSIISIKKSFGVYSCQTSLKACYTY